MIFLPQKIRYTLIFLCISITTFSQNTSILHLDAQEQKRLQQLYDSNPEVQHLCDSVNRQAITCLDSTPKPLSIIYYEGRLETDTARIRTRKSLLDMDEVSTMFYASYSKPNPAYGAKIKEYVLAWATTFKPTGNTINENKFVPLLWGYYLFKSAFTTDEQKLVDDWMVQLAEEQLARTSTPNNNWQAKRLRLIGLIGGIIQNTSYIDYALDGLKEYIRTAYYPDGTSNDLKKRDALHYHVGGLRVLLTIFLNLSHFDQRFDLFEYEAPNGTSIKNCIRYTLPYATGEKVHEEWVNSKVQLDKERAAAGIAEYQPGIIFDKQAADPLFEFAVYYNPDWYKVLDEKMEAPYTATWIGLLNSPWVRKQ